MKKSWPLEDLDCANCAAKMEDAMAKLPGVTKVRVDFFHQTLTLEAPDEIYNEVLSQVVACGKKVEPDCRIITDGSKSKAGEHHHHDHDHHEDGCCCGHDHHHHDDDDDDDDDDHDHDHCHCGHDHDHKHHHVHEHVEEHEEEEDGKVILIRAAVAVALLIGGSFTSGWLSIVLFIIGYLVAGYDVVLRALRNISHGQIFDENFLMAVASIGAMCIGEFAEGVAVMAFYQVGEWFQDRAVDKSRTSISALMDIRPEYAILVKDGKETKVSPEEVGVGDTIRIHPGERVPLDGVVISGTSSLNTTALTGESLPRDVGEGDSVISGCVNLSGLLTVRVTNSYGESAVSRILDLVESSGENKAKTERFITRFARVYTPAVCGAALLLAVIPSLIDGNWVQWLHRALTFLVISCPCALVISVPLTFFSGIGGASKQGVLVKGANYMELLAKLDTVVFDKTGTLTKGVFTVTAIHPEKVSEDTLLEVAALAEVYSDHPISKSLKTAWNRALDSNRVSRVEEVAGHGIKAVVDGHTVYAGNDKLMAQMNIQWKPCEKQGTIVHVAQDGVYMGHIVISDVVKETAPDAIKDLKELGARRLVMLTGDRKAVGEDIAARLSLTEVHAELLPQDKVSWVEKLLETAEGTLAFVGDGINDAPVLARADLGIAMGALGSDAAIEAADVVLMDDDPQKLAVGVRIARKTTRIAYQNIVFALAVKAVVLLLGALGIANMWLAVFADVGVCVLAILNATRAMRN